MMKGEELLVKSGFSAPPSGLVVVAMCLIVGLLVAPPFCRAKRQSEREAAPAPALIPLLEDAQQVGIIREGMRRIRVYCDPGRGNLIYIYEDSIVVQHRPDACVAPANTVGR